MVRSIAKGIAMKTSDTLMSQKWINHPRSVVGKKALLTGNTARSTLFILPMYTNPVKKITVKGVP
jgi:hypothetical protein